VAADLIFEVDVMPSQPVKTPALRHQQVVGGMTANACVAASRLGADVEFASPVGDDAWAPVFEQHLYAEGVRPTGLVRVAGEGSSVSAIVVDARGERMIVNCRGSALKSAPAWDSVPTLAALTAAGGDAAHNLSIFDAVLVDPRCPSWAHHVLAAARAVDLPSVFDADVAPLEDLASLVGLAQWAVFSLPGLQAFSGRAPGEPWTPLGRAMPSGGSEAAVLGDPLLASGLTRALASGAETAVVTLGEHGVVWRGADGESGYLPAFPVSPVVDTLAAGDVFHGALSVALAQGLRRVDALRFASAAAALKCLRPGGALGAPRSAEVDAFLSGTSTS
jgi:sulfofructose kinase